MKRFICFFTVVTTSIFLISAQEALKSTEEEYYDFLSLTGLTKRPTLGYRTLSDSEWIFNTDEEGNTLEDSDENIWKENNLGKKRTIWQQDSQKENWFTRGIDRSIQFKIYGPEWYNSYNTAAPYGQNDGALWQGKGYNTSLTAGARLEGFGFEVTVKPQVSFSQNKSFELMPAVSDSEYSYFQSGIDLPQRFGDDSFWTFDWGDTEIRYTWKNLTAGFGTQSPWLGPAWLNPMLGSNNAATYPKVDLGLRKTAVHLPWLGWYIGDVEGRIWVGRLEESDYFDNNSDNDYRLLNGISLSFAPAFIPGLTVGVNRIFLTDWAVHNLKYIGRLFTLSRSNGSQVGTGEDEDQKVALFADWKFDKVGAEFYGEIGFDDFSPDQKSDFFRTAVYTAGVKQSIPILQCVQKYLGNLRSEFIFEWNNFEMSQDYQLDFITYTGFYSHGLISQGYTQKGQILGAGTGYHGNSIFVNYRFFYKYGMISFFYQRFCPDNNYIYNKAINATADDVHDEYFIKNKAYRTYGFEVSHYITHTFCIMGNFTRILIHRPLYNDRNIYCYAFKIAGKFQL